MSCLWFWYTREGKEGVGIGGGIGGGGGLEEEGEEGDLKGNLGAV